MAKPRVLIVDDHASFAEAIGELLSASGVDVAGTASTGLEAIEKTASLTPDIVLMDVKMPDMDGIQATKEIKRASPNTKVVILSAFDDEKMLFEALRHGADGYILKDMPAKDFSSLLQQIAQGQPAVSPRMASRLISEFREGSEVRGDDRQRASEGLTDRELEVLPEVARGHTNSEIAATLFIAQGTVKYHLSNVLAKLHLRNRAEAAVYAIQKGLVS